MCRSAGRGDTDTVRVWQFVRTSGVEHGSVTATGQLSWAEEGEEEEDGGDLFKADALSSVCLISGEWCMHKACASVKETYIYAKRDLLILSDLRYIVQREGGEVATRSYMSTQAQYVS